MGLMDVPSSYTLMHKIPSFFMFFYAFNGLIFGLGLMDSMIGMMMGTEPAMIPTMTSEAMDCMFFFVAMCQVVIAILG